MAAKVDLEDLFFDFFVCAREYVPEADHTPMCMDLLRFLDDQGYSVKELHGHDSSVDDALEEIFPEFDSDDEDDEDDVY